MKRRNWVVELGSDGQVTIPAELLAELGLKPGDALVVHAEGGNCACWSAARRWSGCRRAFRRSSDDGSPGSPRWPTN